MKGFEIYETRYWRWLAFVAKLPPLVFKCVVKWYFYIRFSRRNLFISNSIRHEKQQFFLREHKIFNSNTRTITKQKKWRQIFHSSNEKKQRQFSIRTSSRLFICIYIFRAFIKLQWAMSVSGFVVLIFDLISGAFCDEPSGSLLTPPMTKAFRIPLKYIVWKIKKNDEYRQN